MCVQNFDDSRSSAIRITYRISLRSSSLWDPRHPLLKVVIDYTAKKDPRGCFRSSFDSVTDFSLVLGDPSAKPASRGWGSASGSGLVFVSLAPRARCHCVGRTKPREPTSRG